MQRKRVTADEPEQDKGTARAWCYTFFLPGQGKNSAQPVPCGIGDGDAPDEQANELHAHLRYFIAQREICPETGRIHWQAYGEFGQPVKGAAIYKAIRVRRGDRYFELRRGEVHWERRRGRRDQARAYCQKDESRDPGENSGPFEWGMFHRATTLKRDHINAVIDLFCQGQCDDAFPDDLYAWKFVPCIKL